MNFYSNLSLKPVVAGLALLAMPLGYSQIPDQDLESIFGRLNGDDFDVRYEARMDLQNAVSKATTPGNEDQPALVEAQLLERLESEPLVTTQLWILRQIQLVGSEASVTTLESLLTSDSRELVDALKMTIATLTNADSGEQPIALADNVSDLLDMIANSDNESIKAAAFAKLAAKSPKQASLLLAESPLPEYVKIAADSSNGRLKKTALKLLGSSNVATQIVVLGALDGRINSKVENQIIAFLDSENTTLKMQALDAIARVGSAKSLDAVLALTSARSKDIQGVAIDTLASISDPRLDKSLLAAASKGAPKDRARAVKAMSFRASQGITELINDYAADSELAAEVREEAIAAMEIVGNANSLSVLVNVVLDEAESGLRKDAQIALKRMTLRTGDSDAAWAAFKIGFDSGDSEAKIALLKVADSAPTKEMVAYLMETYNSGDEDLQKTVVRVLPAWRNWDGGHALLDISNASDDEKLRLQCYKGIGRIILGSDENYSLEGKFELAGAALAEAVSDAERKGILDGFRSVTWVDKRFASNNEIDPELKAIVLGSKYK